MKLDDFFVESLAQQIEGYMLANLEHITRSDAQQVATQYRNAVIAEVAGNYFKRTKEDQILDLHLVSLSALQHKCGRYGPRGKQRYWWPVLNKLRPLLHVVAKGNNLTGKLSQVNTLFEQDWDETAIWTIHEDAEKNPEQYDVAEINMNSLHYFLVQAPHFFKNKKTLANILDKGNKILRVANQRIIDDEETHESWGLLPQYKNPAPSGRLYYGGINLQTAPSSVRHAALGRHFSYDLKRSVFAWQISMLRMIVGVDDRGNPPNTIHTREFIRDREGVIERLSPALKDSLIDPKNYGSVIKEAITAIGFGCRRSGGYLNEHDRFITKGLRSIIKHKESLEEFKNHPWVKAFIAEQDDIIDVITDFQLQQDPTWRDDPRAHSKGKYSKKVFVSFLYQNYEARAMRALMKHFEKSQVLLWVHDGFCTRHRINIQDATTILHYDFNMRDWQLEETFHKGWGPVEKKLTPEQQQAQNELEDRIAREQRHAEEIAHWANAGFDVSGIKHLPLPKMSFKKDTDGHYNDGVSDYDAGRDPYANTNTGLLNERQFIESIYRKVK